MEPSMNRIDTLLLIRSLLARQEQPYTLPELMRDFKTEAGHAMPTFGCKTALDFLRSCPENFMVVSGNRKCYIKLTPDQESSYERLTSKYSGLFSDDDDDDDADTIPSTSNQQNDPQSKNETIPDKLDIMRQGQERKKKKKKKKKRNPHDSEETMKKRKELLEEMSESRASVLCFRCLSTEGNEDSVPIFDRCLSRITLRESDLPAINLPSYLEVGDDIECSVTEVYNPHKFFLHLKRFRDDLTNMMNNMQYFYKKYKSKYAVKRFKFKPSHICAALCSLTPNNSEWYRAKILECGPQMSTVFLVDYGTTVQTKSCNFKFLDRTFGQFPVQAVHGKLATIKPRDGKRWLMDCRKRFYSLVFEEDLMARVVHIDSEKHCLSVVLSSGEAGELRIDKALIEEKWAVAVGDSDEPESLSSVNYESKSRKGMLQPEVIGRNRKPRLQLPNLN